MARPSNEAKGLQITISMLQGQIQQEQVIAARKQADLEHTRTIIDKLQKENTWQRSLIQNLIEIMQRSSIRER